MADPVCGMTVDPATAISAEVHGRIHHFCSAGCRNTFTAEHDPAAAGTAPSRPAAD